jgi:uncharacterized protein
VLTAPAHALVGPLPSDLRGETVHLSRANGPDLAAWWVPADRAEAPVVILAHGVRAHRGSLLGRIRLLSRAGYACLALDLQAHGESGGTHITFGWRERKDLEAAVRWVRTRLPEAPIVLLGQSLGGAAALLSDCAGDVDALILEAVFARLEDALERRVRLRLGPIAKAVTPLLSWQMPLRLGVRVREVAPVEAAPRWSAVPVLILTGAADRRAPPGDASALARAHGDRNRIVTFPDAAHVDLLHHDPEIYRTAVLGFLTETLGAAPRVDPAPR